MTDMLILKTMSVAKVKPILDKYAKPQNNIGKESYPVQTDIC